MARCLLQAKDLSMKFLAEVVYYENYLLNHILTKFVGQVNPINNFSSKKPFVGQLRTFVCVSWAHILDYCRKNLDPRSNARIIMGYSKESKSYRLLDPFKQKIIKWCTMIFYEKAYGFDMSKSPFGPLYSDLFGIVEDTGLNVPPITTLTSLFTSIPELNGSLSTLDKIVTSPNHSLEIPDASPNPFLPRWAIKMIEATDIDVGNISKGQQTCSHKQ